MPRKSKHAIISDEVPEITCHEVASMWRQASKHGPYPSIERCAAIAKQLTSLRGHGSADHLISARNRRAIEAVGVLRKCIEDWLSPIEKGFKLPPGPILSTESYNALHNLRDALEQAYPHLNPQSARVSPSAPIWEAASIACWVIARDALHEIDRKVGEDKESVAVRFAAIATHQLGFPRATVAAIAKRLKLCSI
jgi:hypothetical protein